MYRLGQKKINDSERKTTETVLTVIDLNGQYLMTVTDQDASSQQDDTQQ
ncbi:MAG: hypothetical protein HC862_29635 [Scytonema sp. RU_4_4]|nr:hypothetical protein [Scytonema sp. RU_4_4]